MNDTFSKFHPIVNLIFFIFILAVSMFSMNPVIICISFFMGSIYSAHIRGVKKTLKGLMYMLIMCIMVIVINPLFNHEGMTIITYFKDGNPLTLESVIYGIFMAVMLLSVIVWFECYNVIMTSDKFIYLFGKIMPHLSLLISMSLRYIPRFKQQFKTVRDAQKCIGRDIGEGNVFKRIKNLVSIISIMISWSLENSIETADSMKSRGYGMAKRTAFSIYRFEKRDGVTVGLLCMLLTLFLIGANEGKIYYRYFPTFEKNLFNANAVIIYVVFMLMCGIPMIIDYVEDRKWKYLKSVI